MALRSIIQTSSNTARLSPKTSAKLLYRACIKELPRVLAIYDIDIPLEEATAGIKYHFTRRGKIEDPRISAILIAKGYMEYEETIMQWKNKSHLLTYLQPPELEPKKELTEEEKWELKMKDQEFLF